MGIGYKPHSVQAEEQMFNSGTYQCAICLVLYAALGSRPDISYATSVPGTDAAKPSTLH